MSRSLMNRIGITLLVFGVVYGCSTTVVEHVDDEISGGSKTFTSVEGDFTEAPQSPGGTGVVITEESEPIGEETRSFFTAFQIDPEAEDTSGPKFILAEDVDRDGDLDLISGWNQSQPVQLHLQYRDVSDSVAFRTITIAGTGPIALIAGIDVGYINDDEWLDIVVLSKATGAVGLCPPPTPGEPPTEISNLEGEIIVYFSPGREDLIPDGDRWTQMILVNPLVQDPWVHNQFPGNQELDYDELQTKPEWGGFTDLLVANVDGVEGDDIIVALNPGECEELGQLPPTNTVDLWTNPGPGLAEDYLEWGVLDPTGDSPNRRVPLTICGDAPQVKDLEMMDVDHDGDWDVIVTYTNSITNNIRWLRNPLVPHSDADPGGYDAVVEGANDTWRYWALNWEERPVGQVDSGADVIKLGDIDNDGYNDVVVRSTYGQLIQWFRQPNALVIEPEFPPNDTVPDRTNFPWPVFTLTEFENEEPEALAIGDLTGDGLVEIVAAAEGAVFWYDGTVGDSVFDPWAPNKIIQDGEADSTDLGSTGTTADPTGSGTPGSGVGVTAVDVSSHINALLIIDLDNDGRNDIVGTLDRRTGAGMSDDRLVWYRNVKTDDDDLEEEATTED